MYEALISSGQGTTSANTSFEPGYPETQAGNSRLDHRYTAELTTREPVGAKVTSIYSQSPAPASEPSFNSPFRAPINLQVPPYNYTPQSAVALNPGIHGQLWSPEDLIDVTRSSIAAAHLSFTEPFPPYFTSDDGIQSTSGFQESQNDYLINQVNNAESYDHGLGISSLGNPSGSNIHNLELAPQFCNLSPERDEISDISILSTDNPARIQELDHWFRAENLRNHDTFNSIKAIDRASKPYRIKTDSPQSIPHTGSEGNLLPKSVKSSPRKLRKAKSFGPGSKNVSRPKLSLEKCLNEFHLRDRKYTFEHESPRVSKRLSEQSPFISRRRSAPKLSMCFQTHTNYKMPPASNMWIATSHSEEVPKDMASRLGSFQVQLKYPSSPGDRESSYLTEDDTLIDTYT